MDYMVLLGYVKMKAGYFELIASIAKALPACGLQGPKSYLLYQPDSVALHSSQYTFEHTLIISKCILSISGSPPWYF